MTNRTLKVYGQTTPNTCLLVTADNVVVKNGQVTDELYSFVTSTELHGKASIKIQVLSGSVKITNVTSTYPAIINESIDGFVTFRQPVLNPFVVNKEQIDISSITLNEGDTFEYDHLMFNGPHRFAINTHKDVESGSTLTIGDFLTNKSRFSPDLYPLIGYDWYPFQMGSSDDEAKLIQFIYNNQQWLSKSS
jgi:hypothetical protein